MPSHPPRTAMACPAWDPNPRAPGFKPPAGACDSHFHVFWPEGRYPYVEGRSYTPPDAPLPDFQRLQRLYGIERAVIVQPSVYGSDNRATLEALSLAGPSWRGVVVVEPDIDLAELKAMHELGVRGARVNLLFAGGVARDDVRALAARIAPLGWHLQLLIDVSTFPDLKATFEGLPVEVVFDHMGHMPVARGTDDPGFREMLALLEAGRAWVKLSGAYRVTGQRGMPFDDVLPVARKLLETSPERCVWGSDWPHPACPIPVPNDGDLLDLLAGWAPDPALRDRVLASNPAKLYDFP